MIRDWTVVASWTVAAKEEARTYLEDLGEALVELLHLAHTSAACSASCEALARSQ